MDAKQQLWYARYIDYRDSGISRRSWCEKNGIAGSTFLYWCRKFDKAEDIGEEGPHPNWIEAVCTSPQNTGVTDGRCIRIAKGEMVIELPTEINPKMLLMLIDRLAVK